MKEGSIRQGHHSQGQGCSGNWPGLWNKGAGVGGVWLMIRGWGGVCVWGEVQTPQVDVKMTPYERRGFPSRGERGHLWLAGLARRRG